ncbi:unnamed protein product [Closterium sp. NIES-64]|nr:unnamed protein product [Closterium sp. NIES-64]
MGGCTVLRRTIVRARLKSCGGVGGQGESRARQHAWCVAEGVSRVAARVGCVRLAAEGAGRHGGSSSTVKVEVRLAGYLPVAGECTDGWGKVSGGRQRARKGEAESASGATEAASAASPRKMHPAAEAEAAKMGPADGEARAARGGGNAAAGGEWTVARAPGGIGEAGRVGGRKGAGDGGHARGLEGGAEGDGEMGGEKVRGEAREHGDEWRREGVEGRSGRGGRGNIIDEVAAAMEKREVKGTHVGIIHGEKPADGEAFGGSESAAVEDGDGMLDGIDSSHEGKVERVATVAVDSGHQEVATVASGLPAQSPLLKAAFEAPSDDDRVKVMENGVGFWVAMASGQKTGFYSDQRDSRLFLRSLVASSLHGRGSSAVHNGLTPTDATCNGDRGTGSQNATDGQSATSTSLSPAAAVDTGRAFPPSPLSAHRPLSRVLDLCCYSGGFAINAALAGASDVTAVDSSPSALSLAAANVVLNGLQPSAVRFERADISAFMQRAVAQQQQWDLVVLDPPKLAPTRKSLPRALHRYRRLNSLALRLVAPGGLLMTCSCSGAVSQQHLLPGILREAAASAGRQVTVVREAGAAPCHPIDPACPESTYLTNLLAFVH